jgi:hypothetical protein
MMVRQLYFVLLIVLIACNNQKPVDNKVQDKSFNIDSALASTNPDPVIVISDQLLKISSYGEHLSKLSTEQQNFLLVDLLEMEINNGGFSQFFYNSSGDYSHETVEALKSIGALNAAQMLETAISYWPEKKVPKDIQKRRDIIDQIADAINPKLEKLDDQYLVYPDNINELMIEYVKKNKSSF